MLAAAVAAKLLGAGGFSAYPAVEVEVGPPVLALAALLILSGLAPVRRKPPRRARPGPATPASTRPLGASRA